MRMKRKTAIFVKFCFKHKIKIIFCLLLSAHIFLRFYQLTERANLGWDQIDSAWAAKDIIVDKHLLLQGGPVKGNTGIYMGPLYYYLISPFYYFTNLDPIASPIFAGVTSIFGFLIIFFVTKKLFDANIALMALFINTFSLTIINFERVQNGIGLVVPVSYIVFYFLYKVITSGEKYIPWLAVATGFSFHVDFTSVFYPIIILLSLPFFPRTKKTVRYILLSLPLFLIFILPIVIVELQKGQSAPNSFVNLFNTTFHGFHLRRVLQLTHDAFIQFIVIFQYKVLDYFDFLIPPLFAIIYYFKNPKRERFLFSYLLILWIIVPWFVLATYRGELTDSYFSLPRNIFISILAYFTFILYKKKLVLIKFGLVSFWVFYAFSNLQGFFQPNNGNFLAVESTVGEEIKNKRVIQFKDKDPYFYVYYVYTRNLQKK